MNYFRTVRLVIGTGLVMLVGASAASAQEGTVVKGILGEIGLIPKDPPQINYRERAPLVLPPKADLPPPVDPGSVETRAANWPKDPDVQAARKEAAQARIPWMQSEAYKNSEGKRLSVEEMRAGRRPDARVSSANPAANDRRADKSRMEPDELRSFSNKDSAKLEGNGLERKWLSDPPQSLLTAAGSAPLKATQDPKDWRDPDSPYAFQRDLEKR
jgi:hypothetical protein